MLLKSIKLAVVAAIASVAGVSANAQANLTAETASAGGVPHLTISHLADVAGQAGIANLQVQAGQTLTNSVLNVAEGKTDIAAAPIILTFLLDKGRGPYAKQGENGAPLAAKLRALYPYNAGAYGLFAFESKNINTWQELEGKTIFNGPPRGAALVNARQAITLVTGFKDGDQYQGHQVNWGQLPALILDGSMDAFVMPLTFPSSRVTGALAAGNIKIVSTPKDIFESDAYQKIFKAPGNVPLVVPEADMGYSGGVSLVSSDGVFRGMGTGFVEVVNESMSFDLAKALTAAHIASLDQLKAKSPFAPNIGLGAVSPDASGLCGASTLKYHAGAIEAWAEAGVTLDDCLK